MGLHGHRSGRIPDVFADIDSHMDIVDGKNWRLATRLKIAVLVKNTVVGQIVLMVYSQQLTGVDDRRRIVDVMVAIHEAHHGGQFWHMITF